MTEITNNGSATAASGILVAPEVRDSLDRTRARTDGPRVLLVAMPFLSAHRPSIQIGLLASIARRHGFVAETLHGTLDLAEAIGLKEYEALCRQRRFAVGDWMYSREAFGDDAPDREGTFPAEVLDELPEDARDVDALVAIRNDLIPAHLDRLTERILAGDWDVVGFTSTFQQNVASMALARRLKERDPDLVTLFGGANFEGDMGREYVRCVEAVDLAVSGEGDHAFPELLAALRDERDPASVEGVLLRRKGIVLGGSSKPTEDLDSLPVPDYAEYFEGADKLGLTNPRSRRAVYLPFESSRGCWWGQKSHCTFCGLNGGTMGYRSKSAKTVYAELAELTSRYRSFHLEAVDNILEPKFLDDLFPRFSEAGISYRFFFEIKSNLRREQVAKLAMGGVRRVQPGIESLSTSLLKRMRKGVKASTNVNLLRWCRYHGVEVGWNVLWGFPGERESDYTEQAELFPMLRHLYPPTGGGRVWLERFSPMYTDRKAFPTRWRRATEGYGAIYPKRVELDRAAYFFDYEFEDVLPDETFTSLEKEIETWIKAWKETDKPYLVAWNAVDMLQVEDGRNPEAPVTHTWKEPLASIYRACMEKPVTAKSVAGVVGLADQVDQVAEVLREFCHRGVMMQDGELFLALAIPADPARGLS